MTTCGLVCVGGGDHPPLILENYLPPFPRFRCCEVEDWSRRECGEAVARMGLPHYAETCALNLDGRKFLELETSSLPSLGIVDLTHQRHLMQQIRSLKKLQEVILPPALLAPRC